MSKRFIDVLCFVRADFVPQHGLNKIKKRFPSGRMKYVMKFLLQTTIFLSFTYVGLFLTCQKMNVHVSHYLFLTTFYLADWLRSKSFLLEKRSMHAPLMLSEDKKDNCYIGYFALITLVFLQIILFKIPKIPSSAVWFVCYLDFNLADFCCSLLHSIFVVSCFILTILPAE